LRDVLQDNHPEISGINLRIAKLAGALERTPRQVIAPVEPIAHRVSSASARKPLLEWRREPSPIAQQQYQQESAAPVTREGLDPLLNMAAQIDEASHQLAVLASQRKGIEWDQAELQKSLVELDKTAPQNWRTQPPRLAARLSGGYSDGQLGRGALVALGVFGLALLSPRFRRGNRLTSLADVLVHVQLPLVAALELPPSASSPSAIPTRLTPLRLLTRCGEAFLIGILLTILAAAWFDPSLAAEFRLDPLTAFAETARRLL
jgi:hypothetical protein